METNLFVPYSLTKRLEEKGFDEKCLKFYNDDKKLVSEAGEKFTPAPLYQQVLDWIRDFYDIHIYIKKVRSNNRYIYFVDHQLGTEHGIPYDHYYQALEQAIVKTLNVIDSI